MPEFGAHPLVATALAIAGKIAGQQRAQRSLFNAIRTNRPELARFRSEAEVLFLAYVFAHRDRSRARNLADLWVSWQLDDQRDGFYVEVAGGESATEVLERAFGWTGVEVEPDPGRLADVLPHRRGSDGVDYLSVTAAAGAPAIVSAFDFDRHRVRILTVVQDRTTGPDVERVLTARGYVRVFEQFSGVDGWYIARDLRRRTPDPV